MKTTITEEYEDGKLVRRTTVTDTPPASGGYVWPSVYPASSCSCGRPWNSITAPPPCPVHGQALWTEVICSANTVRLTA